MGLFSLFAPLETPAATVALLSRESAAVLSDPKVREPLLKQGIESAGSTPEALRTQVENEVARWAKVMKDAGISKE
jgi:tripartite-type tricarboxylate transporter receptor subunit TctC